MAQAYQLVIDLGTCHTVAVVRRPGEAPRPLLFDGSPLLPSGVYRDPADGRLVAGRDADRLAAAAPSQFEPYPKRTIDDGSVLLGDAAVPVVELLAAILRRVATEAAQLGGDPGVVTLTCPADWGPRRREFLLAAARAAGMPWVQLVDEPVAAATYCVEVLGQQVPPGQCLLVFDFGGGTLDVTVVRREPAPHGLRVLAVGGLDDLGGVDVDAALVGHLGQLISLRAPQLWQRLQHPQGTGDMRDRKAFWDQVRAAKEMLSRSASAPVPLPGSDDALHLTRDELERVAGPLVDRAVDETRRVLERAGVPREALAGILLVGGSSRIPLVASRLHARFGIAPTVPEQPELPVAYGALLVAAPPVPVAAPGPGPAPIGPPGYLSPGQPVPLAQPGPQRQPVPQAQPRPVSPAMPFSPAPPVSPGLPPRALPSRRRPGRTAVILVAVVAVVAGLTWGGAYAVKAIGSALKHRAPGTGSLGGGTSGGGTSGGGTAGTLKAVAGFPVALPAGAVAAATVSANAVFYATLASGQRKTEVQSVPLPGTGGGKQWKASIDLASADFSLNAVNGMLVIHAKKSSTDNRSDVRVTLDASTGRQLSRTEWDSGWDAEVAYVGTDVIMANSFKPYVKRVNLRDGHTAWTRLAPSGVVNAENPDKPALMWQAGAGSSTAPVPPVGGAFQESLVADATKVVELFADDHIARVLDARTGRPLVQSTSVTVKDDTIADTWTAFDGLLIGEADDGAPGLLAYGLNDLKQKWRYTLPPGADVKRVKACGAHYVCVASDVGGNNGSEAEVMSVNTRSGAAAWPQPLTADTAADLGWYVSGAKVIYGGNTFVSIGDHFAAASVLDPATGKLTKVDAGGATTASAGDGRYQAFMAIASSGYRLSIVDLETGRRAGDLNVGYSDKAQPSVSVTGTNATVVFNGKVYAVQAAALAAR